MEMQAMDLSMLTTHDRKLIDSEAVRRWRQVREDREGFSDWMRTWTAEPREALIRMTDIINNENPSTVNLARIFTQTDAQDQVVPVGLAMQMIIHMAVICAYQSNWDKRPAAHRHRPRSTR
jgi:hypothetical protein